MRRNSGFTLLEVLVAIAVLAIAMSAVVRAASQSGGNLDALRERTFAHWVAENRLAEMQATAVWTKSEQKGRSRFAERDWEWRVENEDTPSPDLRHVIIRVYAVTDDQQPLAVLRAFVSNPDLREGVPGMGGASGGGNGEDGDGGGSGEETPAEGGSGEYGGEEG